MNDSGIKIIPADLKPNNVSPTAEKIVKIDDQGNVDFFIKCREWSSGKDKEKKYVYYKFSFKVDTKFYKDYKSVDDFVSTIQKEQIEDLTASIIKPKTDLTHVYKTYFKQEIQNIDIKIQDILKDMKYIGVDEHSFSITMVQFLSKYVPKEEALEPCRQEFGKIIEIVENIKNKDLKGPLYRPKKDGFLSIFSCCTCGLDNVAENEEGKNEISS